MDQNTLLASLGIWFILTILVAIAIYIITLIHQVKKKEWVWFILTLILGFFVYLIYWITRLFNKKTRKKAMIILVILGILIVISIFVNFSGLVSQLQTVFDSSLSGSPSIGAGGP